MADLTTSTLEIDPLQPDQSLLQSAAAVIRRGGLVAFPTETVYGLGANAFDARAVLRIFEAKGRPAINPVIAHVSDLDMLNRLVAAWPPIAQALTARFWPGPLTLVVAKSDAVPDVVTAGGPTVAVRMPSHPIALGLIRAAGVPLAAPSANRSSQVSPTRAEHVKAGLDGRIDLILDGGPTPNGIESTVLDLTTTPPTLLRPGPISVEALQHVVGPVSLRAREIGMTPLPSPGLLPRHYAPRTPVELFDNRAALERRYAQRLSGEESGKLLFGKSNAVGANEIEMPTDAIEYAARLYEALHSLDRRGLSTILIEMPPDKPEWLAVRDRLTRAAAV